MTIHRDLAAGRWWTLSLVDQMANAGTEVGRALQAKSAGRVDRFAAALDRALELLDLTLQDPRWAGARRREIARARESVCDYLIGENEYGSTAESLDAYFMAFARAARLGR